MANDAKSLRNFAVRKTAIVGNFSSKLIFGHSMVRFLQLGLQLPTVTFVGDLFQKGILK